MIQPLANASFMCFLYVDIYHWLFYVFIYNDVIIYTVVKMTARKSILRDTGASRELSERELNEIMKAVGDRVRAQTADQKTRLKKSLIKELASARDAFLIHGKKTS